MIDTLSRETLKALIEQRAPASISLYMPTHRAGSQTQEGPVRLKNLLKQAERELFARGLRTRDVRNLLEPAEGLLSDALFWKYQSDGLSLFLSPGTLLFYRVPLDFEELVVVNERFHLKPLLPLFTGDGHFYVLALSQNEIRLLEGTRHSVDSVELEDMPSGLADVVRLDDSGRPLQFHTGSSSSPGAGRRPAIFHGHGEEPDNKETILRYFRRINQGLREVLKEEQAPLVLAGVDYLFPLYHEANTYSYLADEGIAGNPEQTSAPELHQRAWEIVHPWFQKAKQEALARYEQMARNGTRTSKAFGEIVPAAHHGRVELLFVDLNTRRWGTYDPETDSLTVNEEAQPGDEDLLDLAAIRTLVNGGAVYAVEADAMPDNAPLAAILRY